MYYRVSNLAKRWQVSESNLSLGAGWRRPWFTPALPVHPARPHDPLVAGAAGPDRAGHGEARRNQAQQPQEDRQLTGAHLRHHQARRTAQD